MSVTRYFAMALVTVALSACSQTPTVSDAAAPDSHSSRTSLDWAGRYQGTRPCADCAGIATDFLLFPEIGTSGQGTALITERHPERSTETTQTLAEYQWDTHGQTLVVSAEDIDPAYYLVGENQLIRLAESLTRISVDPAEAYRLIKLSGIDEITGVVMPINWLVTRLNGHPVDVHDSEQQPSIQLTDPNILSGHTGCNQMRGRFHVMGNQLTIGSLVSTRRACHPASVESELLTSLAQVYRFRLPSANTLHLFDESGSLLMVLSALR